LESDTDDAAVFVPDIPCLINESQQQLLMEELSHHSDEFCGVEHYVLARAFISGLD